MILRYRSRVTVDDLALNECTIHRASSSGAARWWLLWFYVTRDSDGQPEHFCVPVNPRGPYIESGPGGRTWGLNMPPATPYDIGPGTSNWQVSPSINVLANGDAAAHGTPVGSIWHQTPAILGVPVNEPWATGAAP